MLHLINLYDLLANYNFSIILTLMLTNLIVSIFIYTSNINFLNSVYKLYRFINGEKCLSTGNLGIIDDIMNLTEHWPSVNFTVIQYNFHL